MYGQGRGLFHPLIARQALGNFVLSDPGTEGVRWPHAATVFSPTAYGTILVESSSKNLPRRKSTETKVCTRQTPCERSHKRNSKRAWSYCVVAARPMAFVWRTVSTSSGQSTSLSRMHAARFALSIDLRWAARIRRATCECG